MQRGEVLPRDAALWSRAGLISKKRLKPIKNNGLAHFGGPYFGGPVWTKNIQKAFPCSVALVLFFTGALPCSVALVLQFLSFLLVPHLAPSEGVGNIIKPMLFCLFSKWRARRERPSNGSRRTKIAKYVRKINVFCECLGSSLASTWGGHIFGHTCLGCSNGAFKNVKKGWKQMVCEVLGGSFWGDPSRACWQKWGSHAACRSFCVFAERSHAAWRSFRVLRNASHAAWRSFSGLRGRSHAARCSLFKRNRVPMQRGVHFLCATAPKPFWNKGFAVFKFFRCCCYQFFCVAHVGLFVYICVYMICVGVYVLYICFHMFYICVYRFGAGNLWASTCVTTHKTYKPL